MQTDCVILGGGAGGGGAGEETEDGGAAAGHPCSCGALGAESRDRFADFGTKLSTYGLKYIA